MRWVKFKHIEKQEGGVERFLSELFEELKTKSYRPKPVKRVYIPKSNGGQRPLGIPVIRDRIVQTALLLIVEPIFETDFLNCSYGFRPERSCKDALEEIRENIEEGRTAIYDADLKGYFDTIPHDKLMACLKKRITDGAVLNLIQMWLNAPVEETDDQGKKRIFRPKQGTPQDRDLRGRAHRYLVIEPSKKAQRRERDRLREMTDSGECYKPVTDMIEEINGHLLGWANYFKYGYPRKTFRGVNRYVRQCLTRHLQRRSQRPMRPPRGTSFYKHLENLGLVHL